MRATISLDGSDLLKIARLVHDTPHKSNEQYNVCYDSNGIRLAITVVEDYEFGYCLINEQGYSNGVVYDLPTDIHTQIENVL